MTNAIGKIKPNQIHVRRSSTVTDTYHFDYTQMLTMFREAGMEIPDGATVEIYMDVPRGGDWSGMRLEVDRENPIVAIVTHHKVEEENTE